MADVFNNSLEDDTDPITPMDQDVANTPAQPGQPSSGEPSSAILSARGAFYRVSLSPESSAGFYAIEELRDYTTERAAEWSQFEGGNYTETTQNLDEISPILITGMELEHQDIVSRMACLDNVKVFYTFGQAFGQSAITGEILLGPLGEANKSSGPKRLIDFFWKYRVSGYKKPVTISAGPKTYLMYMTGLRILAVQPEYHIMPWVITGTLLDITEEKRKRLNPQGTVFSAGGIANSSLFKALTTEEVEPPTASASLPGWLYPRVQADTVGSVSNQGKAAGVAEKYRSPQPATPQAANLNQILTDQELSQANKRVAYRDARLRQLKAEGRTADAKEFEASTQAIYDQEYDKIQNQTKMDYAVEHSTRENSPLTEQQAADLKLMDKAINETKSRETSSSDAGFVEYDYEAAKKSAEEAARKKAEAKRKYEEQLILDQKAREKTVDSSDAGFVEYDYEAAKKSAAEAKRKKLFRPASGNYY